MDSLPTELLTIILHYLYDENRALHALDDLPDGWQSGRLARYAIFSRRWQAIVEPIIWKNIVLLKPDALRRLEEFTSGKPHRIARIKWVRGVLWEPYVSSELAERLREAMKDYPMVLACVLPYLYHRLYHQAFAGIFHILSRWESICDESVIELCLIVDSPHSLRAFIREGNWDIEDATVEDVWRRFWMTHLVHLTKKDASAYPTLHNVKSFSLQTAMTKIRPSAFFQLLSRLPNVRHASAGEGPIIQPFALRALCEERQLLVHCLPLVPPSVEELEYGIAEQREMSLTPVQDAANYLSVRGLDELSMALRTLSMRLRVLCLYGVRVNSELFWASRKEGRVVVDTLHWPALEDMRIIDVPPYTADGKWILDEDPDKEAPFWGMEDFVNRWDYVGMGWDKRGLIRSREVDKLYSAMGKAVQRMPRLRSLEFGFYGEVSAPRDGDYLKFNRDQETRKAYLTIDTEWEYDLGEEVITAWGLEGEKAEEFRTYWTVEFDDWPPGETARPA